MCSHINIINYGNIRICLDCGMSVYPNGKVFFERNLPGFLKKRAKRKEKKNGKKVFWIIS